MAVLYQLLRHDADARAIPELGQVDQPARRPAGGASTILPLTYHLIGASSLESAIFGGYVTQVRTAHPDCPLPGGAPQRRPARQRRRSSGALLGDDQFFATLNGGSAGGGSGVASGLGGLRRRVASTGWDATSYEQRAAAPAGDPRRNRLVSDLVRTMFPAFASSTEYVDLDTGLAVIAQHARDLGYDAVVLFLDELILWLASHLGNREFVTDEGAKLAKLVESQDARRAIPLVSFVARQRDLVEFLGTHVPGRRAGGVRRRLRLVPRAVRGHPAGGPQPADDRRAAAAPPGGRRRRSGSSTRPSQAIDRRPEVWDVLLTGSPGRGRRPRARTRRRSDAPTRSARRWSPPWSRCRRRCSASAPP